MSSRWRALLESVRNNLSMRPPPFWASRREGVLYYILGESVTCESLFSAAAQRVAKETDHADAHERQRTRFRNHIGRVHAGHPGLVVSIGVCAIARNRQVIGGNAISTMQGSSRQAASQTKVVDQDIIQAARTTA